MAQTNNDKLMEKVEKYRSLTEKALEKIEIDEELDEEKSAVAEDFLSMCRNYLEDGKHFEEKGELLTALAAFSYAHAWLDAGVRARFFKADDDQLFTLP